MSVLRRLAPCVVFAAVVGCTPRPVAIDAAAIDASMPDAPTDALVDASLAHANYMTLRDAVAAGDAAIGKTVLAEVWRDHIESAKVSLRSCRDLVGEHELLVSYPIALRQQVKAIRTTDAPAEPYRCPRVVFKLTGIEREAGPGLRIVGEIERVFLDIAPKPPAPLPRGVDYVSIDDVNSDEDTAKGKIAQIGVRPAFVAGPNHSFVIDETADSVRVYACEDGRTNILVRVTAAQRKVVESLSDCQTIKVKLLTRRDVGEWDVAFIELVK